MMIKMNALFQMVEIHYYENSIPGPGGVEVECSRTRYQILDIKRYPISDHLTVFISVTL